jgi:hypothetical protein
MLIERTYVSLGSLSPRTSPPAPGCVRHVALSEAANSACVPRTEAQGRHKAEASEPITECPDTGSIRDDRGGEPNMFCDYSSITPSRRRS